MNKETSDLPGRRATEFDVMIVGAATAGLSAAMPTEHVNPDLTVMVLEESLEVGAHMLSSAIVDSVRIDALLPGWREEGGEVRTLCGCSIDINPDRKTGNPTL